MSSVNGTGQVDNAEFYEYLQRKETSSSANDKNRTDFLTLLTTQLRNQDPLNPMENAELTSQLAQMSTVEGIERLNEMVAYLLMGQAVNSDWQATTLVGRGVLVEGKGINLTADGGVAGFELDGAADKVVLTITDSSGLEVGKIELNDLEAGSHNYTWDGTMPDGTRAADGKYTVSVEATSGGSKVEARTLEYGLVTSAILGANGTDLQVGSLGIFKLENIRQIL